MENSEHMTRVQKVAAAIILTLALAGLAFAALGCGVSGITAARHAVATAAKVQKSAIDSFTTWDKFHMMEIVDQAKDMESGNAALAKYRAEREKVVTAIRAVWAATVATETAINLAEAGQKDAHSLGGYVTALLKTVHDLIEAAALLGVPLPAI
jgi:hypothetical protein